MPIRRIVSFLSLTCWKFEVSLDVVKSLLYGCISTVSHHKPPLLLPSLSLVSPATGLRSVSVYHPRDCPAKEQRQKTQLGLNQSLVNNVFLLITQMMVKKLSC